MAFSSIVGAPDGHPVTRAFHEVLARVAPLDLPGEVAGYIPELATADPDRFGIAGATVLGRSYAAGDAADRFTIQSISKPFVFALALAEQGRDAVLRHVGVEPSGEAFNAISFDRLGRPANPMINAGAIVTTSLIPARTSTERLAAIREGLSAFAGRELRPDGTVYRSESGSGDRNRALATLAKASGVLGCEVPDAVEPYFQQCSLVVDCADLAVMGATLANNGVNPVTGARVITQEVAQDTLSVMTGCGMYDRSGAWIVDVGMPAKSGVGGGILAVAPGQFGIGVFSPPLDDAGNSSRGVAALRLLSRELDLHMFHQGARPASPVQEILATSDPACVTVRARGALDFVAAEELVAESVAAADATPAAALVIDLTAATAITTAARRLIRLLAESVRAAGHSVTAVDPDGVLDGAA